MAARNMVCRCRIAANEKRIGSVAVEMSDSAAAGVILCKVAGVRNSLIDAAAADSLDHSDQS